MSMVDNGVIPSQSGRPVLNWWHAQSAYTRNIMISYMCAQTKFERLKFKRLKVRF